jgi:hypothetical protein
MNTNNSKNDYFAQGHTLDAQLRPIFFPHLSARTTFGVTVPASCEFLRSGDVFSQECYNIFNILPSLPTLRRSVSLMTQQR